MKRFYVVLFYKSNYFYFERLDLIEATVHYGTVLNRSLRTLNYCKTLKILQMLIDQAALSFALMNGFNREAVSILKTLKKVRNE